MVINYFKVLLNKESNKVSIINYYPLWINKTKLKIELFQVDLLRYLNT